MSIEMTVISQMYDLTMLITAAKYLVDVHGVGQFCETQAICSRQGCGRYLQGARNPSLSVPIGRRLSA